MGLPQSYTLTLLSWWTASTMPACRRPTSTTGRCSIFLFLFVIVVVALFLFFTFGSPARDATDGVRIRVVRREIGNRHCRRARGELAEVTGAGVQVA